MELERFVRAYNDFCAFEYGDPRCEDEELTVEDVKTIYPKVNLLYTYADTSQGECEMQVDYDTVSQELVVDLFDREYRREMPIEEMTEMLTGYVPWDDINCTALDLLEKKGLMG